MFSHYFKHVCILVQITIKGPDLLQNRSQKSPDSTRKSFFPLLQHISAQSTGGKILYCNAKILKEGAIIESAPYSSICIQGNGYPELCPFGILCKA